MGGYRKKPKLYTLKWAEGDELHGLEVTTKGASIERLTSLAGMAQKVRGDDADVAMALAEADKLFGAFAACLVSWNLEDENGAPLPPTYEAITGLDDFDFVIDLVTTWLDAVSGVDNPLPQGSANGASALEASLPMETLSPSLVS
jgi:hypothetical protein